MKKAIVVVDELYDFITGGALACGHSEEAVEETVNFIRNHPAFPALFVCDHHPANHCSFAAQGGPWPPHCVAGTHGGEIHEALLPYVVPEKTFFKGCDPALEQYSGFDGRSAAGESLAEALRRMGIERVYVTGIATEYCVLNTVKDLIGAGFKVTLVESCLGWVDAEGHKTALPEIRKMGAWIMKA